MSVVDLRRLVQRATPRVEDVRSPDRTDFIRREHGHLPLREVVDALDALQFSSASFLACFRELQDEPSEGAQADAENAEPLVLSKEERLKRYCAAKPAAEMSNDTAVHQLYRLLSQAKILDLEQEATSSTHSTPSSSTPEWTTVPESNWKQLVATEKAKGGECFKQKDFQAAIKHYTKAIQASPKPFKPDEVREGEASEASQLFSTLSALLSNRCAARLQLDEGVAALADARTCVQLTPSWPKGRFREGCCLRQLGLLEDAQRAFAAGQKLEPDNKEWCKELEKTEKLLLAQPAYQVKQLLMQLLPDVLAAWLRVAQPNDTSEYVLQLQVNGPFQQLFACKWRQLQEGLQPGKAQIRYAILDQKGYFANLAMNLQSSSPEGFATRDLQGNLLSIPKIKQFLDDSERKSVALHIDVKDESKDNGMKSIITSLPLEDGLERFVSKAKSPDPPKASIDSVLTIQRRSGFPKSYPKYLGFQMFPGDLNFPVIDLLRDAPAHAGK
mmetsp:Transcript_1528/g.3525  ORF Transcript_1528/g.3525 Transcript_1528/m.3525 type:complete len:500 (-) Transcript_1528:9-1508(-)